MTEEMPALQRELATKLKDLPHTFVEASTHLCDVCGESQTDARHSTDQREMATHADFPRERGV